MTGTEVVAEALRQMIDGDDIATADWLCADLAPDAAARRPGGSPYSMATIVWHTWFWVNAWNTWIRGDGDPFGGHDPDASWPEVAEADWPLVRDRLGAALHEASRLAAAADPDRVNASGRTTGQCLLQITVHTAYHFGQMALIRQELGLWPPPGGE